MEVVGATVWRSWDHSGFPPTLGYLPSPCSARTGSANSTYSSIPDQVSYEAPHF